MVLKGISRIVLIHQLPSIYVLQIDRTLWSSITELSDLGVQLDVQSLFGHSVESALSILSSGEPPFLTTLPVGCSAALLEDRRIAESGSGIHAHGTPNVALSLGLSSALFHVPLATPGSMPQESMHRLTTRRDSLSDTQMAHSHASTSLARTGLSTGPRVALFDMSLSTPGLTPIPHATMQTGSMGASSGLGVTRRQDGDELDSTLGSAIPCELRGMANTGSISRFAPGSAPPSALGLNSNFASRTMVEDGRILQELHDQSTGGLDREPCRRVSFGPSARLSFSGAGDASLPWDRDLPEDTNPTKVQRMQKSHENEDAILAGGGRESMDEESGQHAYSKECINTPAFQGMEPVSPIALSAPSPAMIPTNAKNVPITQGNSARMNDASSAGKTKRSMAGAEAGPGGISEEKQSDASPSDRATAILTVFASSYQLLSLYQCRECVNTLHRLPKMHFSCGWVQQMLGKAYYEMNSYKPASLALREMLRLEPFRMTGTEILSTTLWHLKREKELCALAQQVVEVDRTCPEAWCVVGNCFSLQREPEAAIKFFQRALQLDPTFTYAHTLSGHESVSNEDLDKAVASFRLALFHDERHYNAWYGLGSIYYRQERYELAEYHFRRALRINGASSVLQCYLGMVLQAQGSDSKSQEALSVLTAACGVDPKNPQLHFQRAHVLLANRQLENALQELELVREQAPREPPVHIMMGQVCQQLGYIQDALRHFNTALVLDPKEAVSLKGALESLDEPLEEGGMSGYMT